MTRPLGITDADHLTCPRCGRWLRGAAIADGVMHWRCQAVLGQQAKADKLQLNRCQQHVLVARLPHGLALVVAITHDEFEAAVRPALSHPTEPASLKYLCRALNLVAIPKESPA